MTPAEALDFRQQVLAIVAQIPRGHVCTYGLIAAWAGWPDHARHVGGIMRHAPEALQLPCHRVVNHAGRTAPGWLQQRTLLQHEGITFRDNGNVDMRRHLWQPLTDPPEAAPQSV